jgi:PPP family 3-phenylpropionic acid transporter
MNYTDIIDRSLPKIKSARHAFWQIAAITFMTYGARGLVMPFLNLYLVSVGFSGTDIGVLISLSALAQLFVTPFLNAQADRHKQHRRLFRGQLIANINMTLGLIAVGNPLLLRAVYIGRDLSDGPSAALLSQLTLTWLEQRDHSTYGRLRGWGSLGWAVTTFVSGRLFALGGYALLFICAALCNSVSLLLTRVLPKHTSELHVAAVSAPPRPRGFYLLMVSYFLFFIGMNSFSAFSYIYFRQDLGASPDMIGLLVSVAALSEIPAMMLIDRLLRRVDLRVTLLIGSLGLGGLWLAFAAAQGTALLIPLMLVRGTFYTLQTVSLTLLVARLSHPSNAATNQALSQVTIPALAVLLSGGAAGWLFDHVGARALFSAAALTALLASMVIVVARHWLVKQNPASSEAVPV